MKFKTTLYNRQVDLMKHPHVQDWDDYTVKCEIKWRMQEDRRDEGISIAWFADSAKLDITVLNDQQENIGREITEISTDNNWTIEFEESGLVRGEFFQPTGIIIQWDEKKAFCTLIRQEGDNLPF